jgi:hypothetical protein
VGGREPGRRAAAVALAAIAALGCAGARRKAAEGPAPETAPRAFPVPDHGALVVDVPRGWSERRGAEEGGPATLELAPPGRGFVLLLTPFFDPGDEPEGQRGDTARLLVELARRKALSTSAEEELPLRELTGPRGVRGYWFAATDRAMAGREAQPDEYPNLVQGAAAVGRLVLAFTLLDHGPGPHRERALELVRTARHQPAHDEAPAAGGGPGGEDETAGASDDFEPDPSASTVPLLVSSRDGEVTVLVDLPGFQMFRPRAGADGASVVVLGQDPATGAVASVLLRKVPGADATGCREDALSRISRAKRITDLTRTGTADAARASYVLPELNGRPIRQAHVHLFLARGGVCVNVHLSKANPGPADAARLERILASVRLAESL